MIDQEAHIIVEKMTFHGGYCGHVHCPVRTRFLGIGRTEHAFPSAEGRVICDSHGGYAFELDLRRRVW